MTLKRSPFLPAAVGGLVSAAAVAGIMLATGAIGDEGEPGGERATASAAPSPTAVQDVYEAARRGVVLVEARQPGVRRPTGPPRRGDGIATGSGFVIDDRGYVVTNDHIVAGGSEVSVGFSRDDEQDAKVVGRDPSTDLALLRVDDDKAAELKPLPLGDSDEVRIGDPAIAIGNPFGLERTLTAGVVSATDRHINAPDGFSIDDAVQTDAPINSGNSGGPLLNADGEVIGVNSQSRGEGLGFAVPVDIVKDVIPKLRRDGEVRRAYLGVSTTDARRGALVEEITDAGPADNAGVRRGDVIAELGGRPIRSPGDVARTVGRQQPGNGVEIVVVRGERRITLRAELAERPSERR
jgi:putative serine protease PepD